MSTPYLRTNQRTSRVVVAPRSRDATWPANAVRPRLGSTYWGRTLRRSDTGCGGAGWRRGFYRRVASTAPRRRARFSVFFADADRFLRLVARGRARADWRERVRRRRRWRDRRDRGLRRRRSGVAQLQRPHRAQRGDVRAAGTRLHLSLVRHPLVPELRLRAGRPRCRGPDPRPRA